MDLIEVLYLSRRVSETGPGEINDILQTARAFNAANGVTGLLLYGNEHFFQLLEGPAATLDALVDRIKRDPRHTGMIVLARNPIPARSFDGWSMGLGRMHDAENVVFPQAAQVFDRRDFCALIGLETPLVSVMRKMYLVNELGPVFAVE